MYSLSGQLLYERINGAYRQNYYLGSQLIAHQGAGEQTFIHPDILGTTAGKTNSDGGLIKPLRYAPFGLEWGKTNASSGEDEIGYTGHKHDKSIGLTYMQARYYDPVIGRFYSNDPVGTLEHLSTPNGIHGFNRYTYANNNPYKYTDPTGMSSYNPQGMAAMHSGSNLGHINPIALEAGKATKHFLKNYSDMKEANTIGADKYFHCKANCEASYEGDVGEFTSEVISDVRELVDQNIKGDPKEASEADQKANQQGRKAGSEMREQQKPQQCPVACGDLKPEALDEKFD